MEGLWTSENMIHSAQSIMDDEFGGIHQGPKDIFEQRSTLCIRLLKLSYQRRRFGVGGQTRKAT